MGRAGMVAGQWAVFCHSGYRVYMSHEVGVIDSVKPKTVWAKVGFGRRLYRFDHANVIPAASEGEARQICARLDSARAEAQRRENAAAEFYRAALDKARAQETPDA